MPQLAPHVAHVPPSGIRRLFEIALTLDDVVNLAVGEPNLPVAPHVAEAARRAWAEDRTDYGPNGGIAPLRRALVRKLAARNGLHVGTEQVWVTVGATQALHQALALVLGPGDEILVPDPGYTTFTMSPRYLGAVPVPYPLRRENGFLPDPADLRARVTPRTRAVIVNSPSNPLGVVIGEDGLREILAAAREHDLWVISDEVYEHFTYGSPHVSVAALDPDDRVLSVFSLSKSYAMTGVRVGYLVTPPGLDATLRTVTETTISCVAMPDQYAALAAVTGPQDAVEEAAALYGANRDLACAILDELRLPYRRPDGGFYAWVDVSHASGGDVAAWAEAFLRETRVAVAPGSAFGASGEGWVRVSLAVDPADLARGLKAFPGR